jgi:ribosomal protein S6E (S10)
VAALDDPTYPLATFQWKGMSEAEIRATVARGQVIAVQVTYEPGWEAWANGRRLTVRGDAIGQMVIEPERTGPCVISLRYTGGKERVVTRAMSLTALLVAIAFGWRGRRRGVRSDSAATY